MVNKENAKQQIKGLLEKYRKVVAEKRLSKYKEEETKKDFILPLFRALGWNVENSSEVTAEETISKGRVDYGFRISGIPKFFLEAKALKEDLDNPKFAEQAINYAWHKGCIWAVLTDFESVKIFNAEWKTTDLFQSHLKTIPCQEFLGRFEELWLLSKESFEQGLLDKEAEKWGKKSKKSPVGEQLFNDLTKWRSELSKDISQRNKGIKEGDLDEAVQRIIDRLIFIRNCEDRELEPPTLLSTMREWDSKRKGSLAENIVRVFKHFDDEYNSKLFQHHLCDDLDVSNQVLEVIIEELYHTKDRTIKYDFAVLDADVLGNVYEQYLGHILKKTAKRAIVEEKHAYRKEQGIYYTPTYIVDYIVKNTLGELLKDKKVDVEKIRVLDPACGSGSFLIKAFDVLNEFYIKTGKDYGQTRLDLESGLPFTQKVKILQDNIFGVDLDVRAVEIAQLNLLLKIAEKRQRLPLLQQNIKCGNSLIDNEKVAGDKAFKWEQEFKHILGEGGFDVVIGNPPYVNMQTMPELQKFCKIRYPEIYTGQNDILYYFVLRGLSVLKKRGKLGFIVSRYFLESSYATKFRKFILENSAVETIIDFNNFQVFGREVNVLTSIIILRAEDESTRKRNSVKIIKLKNWNKNGLELMSHILQKQNERMYSDEFIDIFEINQDELTEKSWTLSNPKITKIKEKVEKDTILLDKICDIGKGMETGLNEAFVIENKKAVDENIEQEVLRNYVKTMDLKRFIPLERDLKIIYIPEKTDENKIKNALKHLERWQTQLKRRYDYKNKHCEWYSWGNLRNRELFEKNSEKIITPLYSTSNKFVYDSGKTNQNYYTLTDTYIIVPKSQCRINLKYVLALLNSKLIEFYFKNTAKLKREGYYEYSGGSLSKIPIKHNKKFEDRIVPLAERILSLKKRLNEIGDKKTDERQRIEEEINKTDAEIDELVYKLYGITEEEKKIIEESLE